MGLPIKYFSFARRLLHGADGACGTPKSNYIYIVSSTQSPSLNDWFRKFANDLQVSSPISEATI